MPSSTTPTSPEENLILRLSRDRNDKSISAGARDYIFTVLRAYVADLSEELALASGEEVFPK